MAKKPGKKELEKALAQLAAAGIEVPPENVPEVSDDRSDEEKVADNVWMVMAFYLDDTSQFKDVKRDAREEREVRGDNVKVFAHCHSYREECNSKCEEM